MQMTENNRFDASLDQLDSFPPTVSDHTSFTDGYRLHTIDPDEDTDIDVYDDE